MKQCLTRYLFIDEEVRDVRGAGWRNPVFAPARRALSACGLRLVRTGGDRNARETGRDWPRPPHAETMIGLHRLDNVQRCVTDVLRRRIPGDLIETGVWRGGTTIFMRAILAAFEETDRRVWVADSFKGLPKPNAAAYPADEGLDLTVQPELTVGLDEVKANFARYKLLDSQVEFLVGWFKDTLASAPIDTLSVIRLDGDMYESTTDALTALYPKLSVGGYVIVDDYHDYAACARAINDYRAAHASDEALETIDGTGVYWQKLSGGTRGVGSSS